MDVATMDCRVRLFTLETVKAPSGVIDPTFCWNAILAFPAAKVRLPGPLTVLKKVIGCESAEEFKDAVPVVATAPTKEISPPVNAVPLKLHSPIPV